MATIKAGTYIFLANPVKPSTNVEADINAKTFDNNGREWTVTWIGASETPNSNQGWSILIKNTTLENQNYGNHYAYGSYGTNGWYYTDGDADEYTVSDTTKLRTLIVSTAQTVNDNFYTWFIANTTYTSNQLSVDLTTLPGWANLSSGNHTIKIKAKGTGYKDSELSVGVTVSKAASTVTLEAGTYKFKDILNITANTDITEKITATINTLTANNVYGSQKTIDTISVYRGTEQYGTLQIFNTEPFYNITGSDWKYMNENGEEFTATDTSKLRTVIFETDQQVSPEFYNWAITQGNLVKQVSSHTLTISDAYTYDLKIDVNGNDVTSPYTLQNGDIINVPTVTQSIVINGTSYATGYEGSLNINGEDIAITRTGPEQTIDPDVRPATYITIHYTQS